jgi:hypothetical protein
LSGACAGVDATGDLNGDEGTFVWAGSTEGNFVSTGPNQFLVRAPGGVGINTNEPKSELHVRGPDLDSKFDGHIRIESSEEDGTAESGAAISFQGHDGEIGRVWGVIRSVKENSTIGDTDSVMRFFTRSFEESLRETMRIDSDGNVYNTNGAWSVLSDRRLKDDIRPLAGALDRLLALEGVTFRYREPDTPMTADGVRTGFLAQQVEQVFPEWVGENAEGIKYVSPSGFEALTVEALRELARRQEATIAELREQADNREQRLARLEMQMRALAAADRNGRGASAGGQR